MKHGSFLSLSLCLLLLAPVVAAQGGVATADAASSLRVSTLVEAPQSNVDLLQESLKGSGLSTAVPATPQTAPAVQALAEKAPAPAAASTAPAAAVPAVAPTAVPAAAQTVPAAKSPVSSANTLDMPLEVGGIVQNVQTAVAPAAKQLSPAAARRVQAAKRRRTQAAAQKMAPPAAKKAEPTELEKDIEKSNALLPASQQAQNEPAAEAEPSEEEAAADAELEYAVKMLEKSKEAAQTAERKIPPSAAQNRPATVPAPNKKFNPNAFRPGVTWIASKSTHFEIYTQKRTSGISSSNMPMTFESSYQTLRRFIPWMMSGTVRVFVYQDHQSYLRHEPNAKAWTRALAYPTRGEIVVYDEPGKTQELKEVFTHELTHIFTQQFFDSHKTGRIMTPTWLDEGLAVLMEDQAYNGLKGGPWNNDFKTLNFQRDPSTKTGTFGSSSMFGSLSSQRLTAKRAGKPIYLVPFDEFMKEDSLSTAEARNKTQEWYFQAYLMVRFLLNPAGGSSPSNRMQFEQFTRLLSQGEAVRNPSTGFLMKDSRGKTVYEPYSVEKALGRAFRYGTITNFEDNFWRWANR